MRPLPAILHLLPLLFLANLTLHAAPNPAFDHSHTGFQPVLSASLQEDSVDYARLRAQPEPLDRYLDQLAAVPDADFQTFTRPQRLAFLLNLYNATTLKLVADHYPVLSIHDIGGLLGNPWKLPIVRAWNQTWTLDHLEHEIVRKLYNEPRIHFALVCAARGCPPLRFEPYQAQNLEQQLDDQARLFLNHPAKNRIDPASHTAFLSPIFQWFRDDFPPDDPALLAFVARYLPPPHAQALAQGGFTIRYTVYDWSLNAPPSARTPGLVAKLLRQVRDLGALAPIAFILLYAAATVFLVPGSAMTLGAGALFGLPQGCLIASAAATLGATLAFLTGRYIARDWITRRIHHHPRLAAIDAAVTQHGWKIVGLARLSPALPFTLLNYAFALTRIPLAHYVVASWIGMLPGTLFYVYLGSIAHTAATTHTTPAEWALRILGLLATLAVTLLLTRIARRSLANPLP